LKLAQKRTKANKESYIKVEMKEDEEEKVEEKQPAS